MLDWVNMVSFAVTEANLYLDTHPGDPAALSYFQEYSRLRNQALNDFAALYGPHTAATARAKQQTWEWGSEPRPGGGGAC